eukprot:GHRR01005301.1.p1 GENE.GHRR01005301.1~~GHRR01005301.1.p1  ORF type:complete len:388 (+),score=136.91 GHRR01005301.1:1044-2207(+)
MQLTGASAAASANPTAAHTTIASLNSIRSSGAASLTPSVSLSGNRSGIAALLNASSARLLSHNIAALAASTKALPAAGSLYPNPWIVTPAAAPATAAGSASAAAAATAAAEEALAASLRSVAAASTTANSTITGAVSNTTAAALRRPGFLATAGIIYRLEGPWAFSRGIQASAARAVCNGGIRLGLYDPIKTVLSRDGTGFDLHIGQKLAAGSISGGIGAVLTTPMELVKTRLQAPSTTARTVSDVLHDVLSRQGVMGLWSGATPSVLRLILLNGSMVATYDEVKGHIQRMTGWSSGLPLVLSSSMVAGLVTTTVINPADVARAYMQTGRGTSLTSVMRTILAKEGLAGFMKGWTAAYARTGPQTLIIFTVSEFVRPVFGLKVIGAC